MEYLVGKGLDMEATDNVDQTALHLASYLDRVETTSFLLKHGANPFAVDEDGDTPLHAASDVRVAELLMDWCTTNTLKGERCAVRSKLLSARNGQNNTPYEAALRRKEREESVSLWDDHQETIGVLYSYVAPLAVPDVVGQPSVIINPKLSVSQRILAEQICHVINKTDVHQIGYHIMGYLCIFDVMER